MSAKKKNELKDNTKDNPYDNYFAQPDRSGQNLDNSITNKDSKNATGKDSKNSRSKKNKNK